jgi:hypothetical protein
VGCGPQMPPASPRRVQRLFCKGLRGRTVRGGARVLGPVAESPSGLRGRPGGRLRSGRSPLLPSPHPASFLLWRLHSQPRRGWGVGGKEANLRMGTRPWLPVFPPPLIRSPPLRPSLRPAFAAAVQDRIQLQPAGSASLPLQSGVPLSIGRRESRPGFQLAEKAVPQQIACSWPRLAPCALWTRRQPASPGGATPAARCFAAVAAPRRLAVGSHPRQDPECTGSSDQARRGARAVGVNHPPADLNGFITSLLKKRMRKPSTVPADTNRTVLKLQGMRGGRELGPMNASVPGVVCKIW